MNDEIYYMKQNYRNKNGNIFYSEIHEITFTENRGTFYNSSLESIMLGKLISSRKTKKYYDFFLIFIDSPYIKRKFDEIFGLKSKHVTHEIVLYEDIENELFLENI